MKYTKEMSSKLNELLEKNYDAEAGYKQAAEKVENVKLKKFFSQQAQHRYDFGHELKTEIRNYGESPDKGTSIKGDVHRTWIDIKTALSSNKEESLFEEVKRGEHAAVEDYNKIISDTTLPPTTQSILTKQRDSIQSAWQNADNFEKMFS